MKQGELFSTLPNKLKEGSTKVCTQCGLEKNQNSFRLYRRATGDRNSSDSKCKKSQRYNIEVTDCCGDVFDKLVLDHCHESEVFRGWLCDRCNRGIGVLGDTLESLEKALKYLRKHDEQ